MNIQETHPDIRLARTVAAGVHRGQLVEDGTRALDLLARTVELVSDFEDPVKTSAAWMRLVLPESSLTVQDLTTWGVAPAVLKVLNSLARDAGEDEAAHLTRLVADQDAVLVELAARLADSPGPRALTREEQMLAQAGGVWSRLVLRRAGL